MLEAQAIAGDLDAVRSLACMALLAEGWTYTPPDGGDEVIETSNIIDFEKWRNAA